MARDPRSCSCSRWSVPLNTALIYSYLRLLQCSLLYIHYGNGTRCVPSERSRAASSPARVSDTFDNPINIYEALYWNNTELLYTHTYVGVVVCLWVWVCMWMQHKTSNKRDTRSIVSRRTCRKLHGIWTSCLHSSGCCCCCCSHIAHTHHRSVPLWCFDAVSLVRPSQRKSQSQSERSSIAIFNFLIILKAMSALCWLHRWLLLCVRVCVWVGVCVCV